ncbi:MAG: hypothetical protein ABI051_07655 [Vicinamibacterales bacterium]
MAPSHVRKGAKRFLLADGQDVHDDADDLDYETQALSNLGLLIKTGQVQIRLLRSATGHGLPVPGQSIARRQYYNQLSLFDSQSVGLAEGDPLVGRFVLHWSTDAEYNLERVYLALPKTGGETRDSVEAYWDWPIWRRHSLVSDGQVQAEVLDVDIYLDDEATGTGG